MAKRKTKSKTKARRPSKKKTTRIDADKKRGIWSGFISFGLVNIGVSLVTAQQDRSLHFTMLDSTNLAPVGYRYYNKVSGEDVSRSDTVKGYEVEDNQYVVLTEADFKSANPKATQTIDIEQFVDLKDIDPVYYERAYYILPKKRHEKAYRLLSSALANSQKVGIAKIVLHTKQHLCAVIARGEFLLLQLLHFANEVKDLQEIEREISLGESKVTEREVKMAEMLIEDMASNWQPEQYIDTYRDDILKRVDEKFRAGKAKEVTPVTREEGGEEAVVLDLMSLLRKSRQGRGGKPVKRSQAR